MKFKPNRADGRSITDLIIDLIKDAGPGTVFDYKEIIRALNNGSTKKHTIKDAQRAMINARSKLSRDYQRTVRNIPNKGYKIAAANEHREIALSHKTKSDRQLRTGVQILQYVKWGEMDPESKRAHEGTLMIVSEIYERQAWMDRRFNKIEEIIRKIIKPDDPEDPEDPEDSD